MMPAHQVTTLCSLLLLLVASLPARADHVRTLVRGAAIQGANDVVLGPAGRNLWVSSVNGREIVVLRAVNGRVLFRLDSDFGVETPSGLAFDPEGHLLWAAFFTGELRRLSPDGDVATIATLAPGLGPLTVRDDGRIVVAQVLFSDQVLEIDPTGAAPPRVIAEGLGTVGRFAFGPDGLLYCPLRFSGDLVRIDIDTGASETLATGFTQPVSVAFADDGTLVVVDAATGDVRVVDPATGDHHRVTRLDAGSEGASFDGHGRLVVTNAIDGSVRRVRGTGPVRTLKRGGLTASGGLAATRTVSGRKMVVAADAFSLKGFDARSGRLLGSAPSIPGVSALAAPQTVEVEGGRTIVSSWFEGAVQVLSAPGGDVLTDLRTLGVPLHATALGDDLVVSELLSGSVLRVADWGEGEVTTLADGFAVPAGLAVAGDNLWAADWALGRIVQLVEHGVVLDPPLLVTDGLDRPEGLAATPDGGLVVVETGGDRLLRIDPVSGQTQAMAGPLGLQAVGPPNAPPTWIWNGLAVDEHGNVYVSSDGANRIWKIGH